MLRPNELLQSRSRLTIQDQRLSFDVYPDVLLHILDQAVKPLQKHGSTLHAALEMLLDVGCVKWGSLGKQGLIGRLNGEKEVVQPSIDFDRFATLPVHPTFAWVPQIGIAKQLATELCDGTPQRDASHDRRLARPVTTALFEVEQHLHFHVIHTL